MSSKRKKAQARAQRSQRMVTGLVITTIWLGMIVLLIIPARRENTEAAQLAKDAKTSAQRLEKDGADRPKISVTAAQQSALANALPDRFVVGAVNSDLQARAKALDVTVTGVSVAGSAEPADEITKHSVAATVSGPSKAVEAFLSGLEANATLNRSAGLVEISNGMLLTLRSATLVTRGDTSRAEMIITAYSLSADGQSTPVNNLDPSDQPAAEAPDQPTPSPNAPANPATDAKQPGTGTGTVAPGAAPTATAPRPASQPATGTGGANPAGEGAGTSPAPDTSPAPSTGTGGGAVAPTAPASPVATPEAPTAPTNPVAVPPTPSAPSVAADALDAPTS